MAVQWNLAIGARVCDVVAQSTNDHGYFAVDDCAEVVSPDGQYLHTARLIYRPSLISGLALVGPGMNVGVQARTRSLAGDVRKMIG
jgi:hypothetical protein